MNKKLIDYFVNNFDSLYENKYDELSELCINILNEYNESHNYVENPLLCDPIKFVYTNLFDTLYGLNENILCKFCFICLTIDSKDLENSVKDLSNLMPNLVKKVLYGYSNDDNFKKFILNFKYHEKIKNVIRYIIKYEFNTMLSTELSLLVSFLWDPIKITNIIKGDYENFIFIKEKQQSVDSSIFDIIRKFEDEKMVETHNAIFELTEFNILNFIFTLSINFHYNYFVILNEICKTSSILGSYKNLILLLRFYNNKDYLNRCHIKLNDDNMWLLDAMFDSLVYVDKICYLYISFLYKFLFIAKTNYNNDNVTSNICYNFDPLNCDCIYQIKINNYQFELIKNNYLYMMSILDNEFSKLTENQINNISSIVNIYKIVKYIMPKSILYSQINVNEIYTIPNFAFEYYDEKDKIFIKLKNIKES